MHGSISQALDALAGAALVLDEGLRIVAASPAAEALLGGPVPLGQAAPEVLCGTGPKRPVADALAAGEPVHAVIPHPSGPDAPLLAVRALPLGASGWLLLLDTAHTADRAGAVLFHGMWTQDPAMKEVFRILERVAQEDVPVLVRGETGAGKELAARAVHDLSPRAQGPFRAINCAALPASLLESELFGHARGAFTGAHKDKPGHFQLAHRGTLFLDEVAELPLELQAKLLRVVETRAVLPVGGREPVPVDVRIVSATHRHLREEVEAGRFRADLMFRLRVVPVFLPPLRERRGDIALLVQAAIDEMNRRGRRRIEQVSPAARTLLARYDYPGNVRELRNFIAYAFAIGTGPVLLPQDLPPELSEGGSDAVATAPLPEEARRIQEALAQAGGSKSDAARLLGMSRVTLWRRMVALGLAVGCSNPPPPLDSLDAATDASAAVDAFGSAWDGSSAPPTAPPTGEPSAPPTAPPTGPPSEPPDAGPEPPPEVDCSAVEAGFERLADDLEATLTRANIPGAAFAVVCGGEQVFARGLGLTTPGGAAVTPRTRFQLASTTKMFTATAAVRLAAAGRIDLDAPVDVPYVNTRTPYARSFTLDELLSHSAGFPNDYANGDGRSLELEGFFRANGQGPLWAEPGAVWNYSNNGFAFAGLALSEATGRPFRTLIEDEVLAPLGLETARIDAARVIAEGDFALGHWGSVAETIGPADEYLRSEYYAPMGGVWASALDLAEYARVLMGRRPDVFDARAVAAQTTVRIRTVYPGQSYALGLFVDDGGNTPIWSHGGDVAGFHADFQVLPERGFAVILLFNADYEVPWDFPYRVIGELTDYAPAEDDYSPDLSRAPLYEGTWNDPVVFGRFTVRRAGAGLEMVPADGSPARALEPLWRDGFSMYHEPWQAEADVYFWSDDDNAPATWFVSRAGVARREEP